MNGYVHVYTGDGKGKTTAALGLALRSAGAGLRVYIGQFIKSGAYNEIRALERFDECITCRQYGRGCFILGEPEREDRDMAQQGLAEARGILEAGEHDVVILDEINVAVYLGLIKEQEVLELLDLRPASVELVLTGRKAFPALMEAADLVTEMRERKHYYALGVLAREGIEN